MSRHRNICFTLNNFSTSETKYFETLECRYLVIGMEVGACKTPHLQGYIEFKQQLRFNAIKNLLPRCHIEPRKGTAKQAADYCKKDGKFVERGEISNPGKRTDLETVYNMAKNGKDDIEIGEAQPSTYMKFYKAVDRVRFNYACRDKTFSPVKVYVDVGIAGSGKTRRAYEYDPDLYTLMESPTGIWFDGYRGEKTLLIDDFYGWIRYGHLLKLLDGYKFQLPVKGGFTWKNWDTVIITSNEHPRNWYEKGFTEALARRVIITPPPLRQNL